MKNVVMTADRPTGKLHVGHYVGSLKERVRLQNEGNFDKFFVMIADAQALTDNFGNPQKVRDNVLEVMLDYLAVGLDPSKVVFCVQSCLPALSELSQFYLNLVSLPRLLRNPTVKTELKLRGFDSSGIPAGFAAYPVSQAADITAFKANLIPVGEDQLPMIEQTREIVRSFNRTYLSNALVECKALLPSQKECLRLPGTDGSAKMSKSLGNCIFLSDEPNEIKKKVNSIKTFPREISAPGILENNILFTYLSAFCKSESFEKFYPEYKNLEELKTAYANGGIGDGRIKKFLNDVLQDELAPIRARRNEWKSKLSDVFEMLKQGTQVAKQTTQQTLDEVKASMGLNYFDGQDFIAEQTAKICKN